MGRHRRSDAGRAATSRAAGVTHHDGSYGEGLDARGAGADGPPTMGTAPYLNPEAYAETYARSEAYLYATDETAVPAGGTGFATTGGYPDAGPAPAPAAYAYTASAADTVTAPTVSAPTVPGPRTAEYDFTGHSFAGDPLPEWDVTPRPPRTDRPHQRDLVGRRGRPAAGERSAPQEEEGRDAGPHRAARCVRRRRHRDGRRGHRRGAGPGELQARRRQRRQ